MAEASTSRLSEGFALTVSFAGRSVDLNLDDDAATVADLQSTVFDAFSVPPEAQKLIVKGKRIPIDDPRAPLTDIVPRRAKILLVGTPVAELKHVEEEQKLRVKKREAFEYHKSHKAPTVRSTAVGTVGDGTDQFRFHELRPFPPEVGCFEARQKMLDRLANDPAVREVMIKHKYVVGVLTELHPITQPTLLGLNKNMGQEVSLRLLTDSLDGTRPYLDVRRVLIHELTHNEISPHDNSFKELNSLLTREVNQYETSRGLRVGQEVQEPWNPEGDDVERTAHRLDEVDLGPSAKRLLRFSEEDELDEKRERLRKAAEARQKQSGSDKSRE